MTENIGRVSEPAAESGQSAGEVLVCANSVSQRADALQRAIGEFPQKVQAA